MWVKRYELTRADFRDTVNLKKVSNGGIEKAVKEVLGDSVAVIVGSDYYEYYVLEKPRRGQLIAIGRKISLNARSCGTVRVFIYRGKKGASQSDKFSKKSERRKRNASEENCGVCKTSPI